MEEFVPIIGYEGLYEISNMGNVKSFKKSKKGVLLELCNDKDKYLVVGLSKDKKVKIGKIHRLIAQHFIPNPDNKPCVDHKNQIKDDNRIENLRWCNRSENTRNVNKGQNFSSNFKGVHFNNKMKKWVAQLYNNNKRIFLGSFKVEEEAACAYDKYIKEHFHEFGILNFPDEF